MDTGAIIDRLGPHLDAWALGEGPAGLPPMPRSAEALVVWALHRRTNRMVVWICDGQQTLDAMHRDLLTLAPQDGAGRVLYFPARDAPAAARAKPADRSAASDDPELAGYRLLALDALARAAADHTPPALPAILVTCIQAAMQHVPAPARLADRSIAVAVGEAMELDDAVRRLVEAGYTFEPEVYEKRKACLKGGLLDVWPPDLEWPVRIEFFGSRVESVRQFDPGTQVSIRRLDRATLLPAGEAIPAAADAAANGTLLDYLPPDAVFVWSDFPSVTEHAILCEEAAEGIGPAGVFPFARLTDAIGARPAARRLTLGGLPAEVPTAPPLFRSLHGIAQPGGDLFTPDAAEAARRRLLADLLSQAVQGREVRIVLETDGAMEHFRTVLPSIGAEAARRLPVEKGALSEGFACDPAGLTVVTESELYGARKPQSGRYAPGRRSRRPRDAAAERLTEVASLEPGDLVVHVEHGIGRYGGLCEILRNGQPQEVVTVEYAEGAKLHVPVTQVHLLSRYTGVSRHDVALHRLGTGGRWDREKQEAQAAIQDLASSLLETQARREVQQGFACAPDSPWQHEFEASFPYRETADQLRAVAEVKQRMESPQPMDLLICGDAGYGKTEVALRAAFKAVMGGRQVAVLVPTTVLAQQHFDTFTRRMSAYPVRIAVLSRFCRLSERHRAVEDMQAGRVDIVIGTHALVQPGVRFKDLGLVIVDEEQRFGVQHKEWLKQARTQVDVLTLTATPIPRTLYLSMTGARDMSLVQTPPRDRTPVETVVAPNSDAVVRSAILRELNREGQVFYLHNRVMTIERVHRRLEELVPQARVAVAHGQMAASQLSAVMHRFVAGEFDVLLCTTIIESGTDIPRANTILIDRADRFGLADLYQLRGRVGRSRHRGYAYLLLPPHGPVDPVARRRLNAVLRHADAGAGFAIALRDLEIRGAGNLLGAQQSGHINAIGFGLYCQLLRRTIRTLRGEPPPRVIETDLRLDFVSLSAARGADDNAAAIPYDYIEDEHVRLGVYRRAAEADTVHAVARLRRELRDRFGPTPPAFDRFLKLAELRIVCSEAGIRQAESRDGRVLFQTDAGYLTQDGRFPRLSSATPGARLDEVIRLARTARRWAANRTDAGCD